MTHVRRPSRTRLDLGSPEPLRPQASLPPVPATPPKAERSNHLQELILTYKKARTAATQLSNREATVAALYMAGLVAIALWTLRLCLFPPGLVSDSWELFCTGKVGSAAWTTSVKRE
jgi:hypothetical protein